MILESKHFVLREVVLDDAEFILRLINQPAWKAYIADHSINTIELARGYIEDKLQVAYKKQGFGLWAVKSKQSSELLGLCGLLKRDYLDCVDLGFGFLPEFWGKSIAYETSSLCLRHAFKVMALSKIAAICSPQNARSIALLERLGFEYLDQRTHPDSEVPISLFVLESTNYDL